MKAFSESPLAFTAGFCHVERVMKSLFVSKLFLWPRFQASVLACHERQKVRYSIRVRLYSSERDITSRCVCWESNLMFTLSSEKDQRNSLSRSLLSSVNEPLFCATVKLVLYSTHDGLTARLFLLLQWFHNIYRSLLLGLWKQAQKKMATERGHTDFILLKLPTQFLDPLLFFFCVYNIR